MLTCIFPVFACMCVYTERIVSGTRCIVGLTMMCIDFIRVYTRLYVVNC